MDILALFSGRGSWSVASTLSAWIVAFTVKGWLYNDAGPRPLTLTKDIRRIAPARIWQGSTRSFILPNFQTIPSAS